MDFTKLPPPQAVPVVADCRTYPSTVESLFVKLEVSSTVTLLVDLSESDDTVLPPVAVIPLLVKYLIITIPEPPSPPVAIVSPT